MEPLTIAIIIIVILIIILILIFCVIFSFIKLRKQSLKLLTAIKDKNMSIDAVIALIDGETEQPKPAPLTSTDDIKLVVDYAKTIEQAVIDCGVGYRGPDIIAENFPVSPKMAGKKVDIVGKLFHFNCDITSEYVIKEMDKEGFRPAILIELLTFFAIYSELQERLPIVALGFVWHSPKHYGYAPYLDGCGGSRQLYIRDFDDYWGSRYRFFGIRK